MARVWLLRPQNICIFWNSVYILPAVRSPVRIDESPPSWAIYTNPVYSAGSPVAPVSYKTDTARGQFRAPKSKHRWHSLFWIIEIGSDPEKKLSPTNYTKYSLNKGGHNKSFTNIVICVF